MTLDACTLEKSYNNTVLVTGWVASTSSRGSIDIFWSCCITIVLCCWVSTFPNVPSLNDKWYHPLIDKFNLAVIGFIGPDYLFAIALGQFSSARRSVRMFRELDRPAGTSEWSLVHGFFADMGGILLESPDYPPFPVKAEELHYLIKHRHVDFPTISKDDIKASNKTDGVSKIIVFWQVFWFSASELQRVREGLPMTTFELTALSFSLTMMLTMLCWYAKPTIIRPTAISTKDGRSIEYIRSAARSSTHPNLPEKWYRTPLDFIPPRHHRRFRIAVHWIYYTRIAELMRMPVGSRPIKTTPWDRFPSYEWYPIDHDLLGPAVVVVAAFSVSMTTAWNFDFPTHGEKIAWRVCSVYHAIYSLSLAAYYLWDLLAQPEKEEDDREKAGLGHSQSIVTERHHQSTESVTAVRIGREDAIQTKPSYYDIEIGESTPTSPKSRFGRLNGAAVRALDWIKSWRNISPDGDPEMSLGLRASFFPLIGTFIYLFCRAFFYVEDFVSIRQQPAGVYRAMNKYVPFMN